MCQHHGVAVRQASRGVGNEPVVRVAVANAQRRHRVRGQLRLQPRIGLWTGAQWSWIDISDYRDKFTIRRPEDLKPMLAAGWVVVDSARLNELRDLNSLSFKEAVVLGQTLTLDFARVDAPNFEQRRRAYHEQIQSDFFAAYQIEEIESHVMRPGESLWILAARRYNVPVWLLRQYNPDLNFDRIQAHDRR